MSAAAHGIRVGSVPTTPSSLFLDAAARETEHRIAAAPPITSPHAGADPALRSAVAGFVDAAAPALAELSARIFALAEPRFAETASAAAIAEVLAHGGITTTIGTHGLATALLAEAPDTSDGPTVAILAEYDALPGVGHACGHNLIAAASVGALLALAEARRTLPPGALPGRILLIGTPAEEGGNGKGLLARAGAFDGVDAAVRLTPSARTSPTRCSSATASCASCTTASRRTPRQRRSRAATRSTPRRSTTRRSACCGSTSCRATAFTAS